MAGISSIGEKENTGVLENNSMENEVASRKLPKLKIVSLSYIMTESTQLNKCHRPYLYRF
jgi:hypothetical protein